MKNRTKIWHFRTAQKKLLTLHSNLTALKLKQKSKFYQNKYLTTTHTKQKDMPIKKNTKHLMVIILYLYYLCIR